MQVVNYTSLQVTQDGHHVRLSSAGQGVTLRIPTSRFASKITKNQWHDLPLPASKRRDPQDSEKAPLLPSTAPRIKAYYKHTRSNTKLLLLPVPDLDAHLSSIPDETSLGDLFLPGTHQSLALRGWPVSKCQSSECSLAVQLADGIRFFDIRLAVKNDTLQAYHGILPQHTPFPRVLLTISTFLTAHPREFIILCIQQEPPSNSSRFSQLVRDDMEPYIARQGWFLENRVPQVGEVRGRAVLMSRFGGSARDGGEVPWFFSQPQLVQRSKEVEEPHYYEGECFASPAVVASSVPVARMGWKPERWPDSALDGFTWHAQDTPCRTQDWYEIYGFFNIPAKFNVLTDHLLASADLPRGTNLTLSFASAASIPLALPPLIANGFGFPRWGIGFRGVNARLRDWLLDRLEALESGDKEDEGGMLRGIVPMDFYKGSGLIELMVAFNVVQTQK